MDAAAQQLLLEISRITELQPVRVAVKESFKGAAIAGVSTLVGGLLLGPVGLAIGGTIGGCSAGLMAKNKFRSVPEIILYNLTPAQQNALLAAIRAAVRNIPVRNVADFAVNIARNPTLQTTVAVAVMNFLNQQPGMQIVD